MEVQAITKLETAIEIVKLLGFNHETLTISQAFAIYSQVNEVCKNVLETPNPTQNV